MRVLGFRNICFGGSTRKTQGGFNGYSQGMSRHVSGELFLKGCFSFCDDSNTDERKKEKGDVGGWRGVVFLLGSQHSEVLRRRGKDDGGKRETVLMHCVEKMQLHSVFPCSCPFPIPMAKCISDVTNEHCGCVIRIAANMETKKHCFFYVPVRFKAAFISMWM